MSEYSKEQYHKILQEHGGASRENLFEIFGQIQETFGFVGEDAISDLAERTSVPVTQIYGALTAYPEIKILSERPTA